MNIVQITPGAGGMYCGNCFRDNALVAALRKMGHSVLMVPLYLPLKLEEQDQSAGTPIFFSGINVYLEQKSPFFRAAPGWLHDLLASPALLRWAAGRAAKTHPEEVGDLTISMLRGEEGNQARELRELVAWLKERGHPEVIFLSNTLLIGLARVLKRELGAPVICMLQGEDTFLDALPPAARDLAWQTISERAADADLFIAPSQYFGNLMRERLDLNPELVKIIYNGINLEGFSVAPAVPDPPTLGYFARMCREKGLDRLIEAYLLMRQRNRIKNLRLRVGGGCGVSDQPFVNELRDRLKAAGILHEVDFLPNLNRAGKLEFFRSLTLMSVPALYGEAFGLYLLEALASGVPVVQPRHAAFPELIALTGGGVLFEPATLPESLAEAIEHLVMAPDLLRRYGEAGVEAVRKNFSIERMAQEVADTCAQLIRSSGPQRSWRVPEGSSAA